MTSAKELADALEIKVGDVVGYIHGGELEVVFIDTLGTDARRYQCCLPGGDKWKNRWFKRAELTARNAEGK